MNFVVHSRSLFQIFNFNREMLMRKALLLVLLAGLFPFTNALEVGETAPELEINKWLFGGKFDLAVPKNQQNDSTKLSAIICWGSWLTGPRDVTPLLDQLQKKYLSKGLRIALVTTEPEPLVKQFFTDKKDFTCFVGLDKEEKTIKAYMGSSRIYPKAFLIDPAGVLIWSGEVIDMENIMRLFYTKKFSMNQWKKMGKLYEDLEIQLRSSFDSGIEKITDQILSLNHDNGFAVRARLFYYESTNQPEAALKFLDKRTEANPDNSGLYFAAFSMLGRQSAADTESVLKFARRYVAAFKEHPLSLQQLCIIMMNDFPYAYGALELVSQVIPLMNKSTAGLNNMEKGAILSANALYYYKLGMVDKAISFQQQAVKTIPVKDTQDQLKFYESIQELQKKLNN